MHHKLLFAAGLRPELRSDVVMQDSTDLEGLLEVALRVEASKKEVRPANRVAEFNAVENNAEAAENASGDEAHQLSVDALRQVRNNRGRGGRGGRGGGGAARSGFNGSCHYCARKGHRIATCFTRMNDEKRGIYKAKATDASPTSQTAAVDTDTAECSAFDLDQYLNRFAM